MTKLGIRWDNKIITYIKHDKKYKFIWFLSILTMSQLHSYIVKILLMLHCYDNLFTATVEEIFPLWHWTLKILFTTTILNSYILNLLLKSYFPFHGSGVSK